MVISITNKSLNKCRVLDDDYLGVCEKTSLGNPAKQHKGKHDLLSTPMGNTIVLCLLLFKISQNFNGDS